MVPVPSYAQPQYVRCPNCGSQVTANSNYCNICGEPLHQPVLLKICPRCSNRIPARAKFCPECGKKQPGVIVQQTLTEKAVDHR